MTCESVENVVDAMSCTRQRPYSILGRLSLANAFVEEGYPDLALGEAYLALLLGDEVRDESGEWHDQALHQARQDMHGNTDTTDGPVTSSEEKEEDEEFALTDEEAEWLANEEMKVYGCLISSCFVIGCTKTGYEFLDRALRAVEEKRRNLLINDTLMQIAKLDTQKQYLLADYAEKLEAGYDKLPEKTLVRRELYSWNDYEVDRYSDSSLALLNGMLTSVAPKLEIKLSYLPDLTAQADDGEVQDSADSQERMSRQLGVFAREDLQPGDMVLDELSLLTATSRLNDTFCDACSRALPLRSSSRKAVNDSAPEPVTCPDCAETVFCSEKCLELANESYHPAVCDAGVNSIAKDADKYHAADDLYTLLVLRTFAMAQTQGVHPLDLPEIAYIWGDFSPSPRSDSYISSPDKWTKAAKTLPFSFRSNIELPLQFLLSLPGANPFLSTTSQPPSKEPGGEDDESETSSFHSLWTINTLYAKFRGTASARQGADGKPEVAAVHPLWCLANHSCDPNVKWEWDGGMKFWVRRQEERVAWSKTNHKEGGGNLHDEMDGLKLNESVSSTKQSKAGLLKGDEIFGHYCDVSLPVGERREWAVGALGGICLCERCRWEE